MAEIAYLADLLAYGKVPRDNALSANLTSGEPIGGTWQVTSG